MDCPTLLTRIFDCACACSGRARSPATATRSPAHLHLPERARARARAPVPEMVAEARPPLARRLIGRPGCRKRPDKPEPAAPPSGPGQESAAAVSEENSRRSIGLGETGSLIPATLRRAHARPFPAAPRRDRTIHQPSRNEHRLPTNVHLFPKPAKSHHQTPYIALENCKYRFGSPGQTSRPPGPRRRCARHGRVPCSGIHSFTSIFGSRQTSERVPERKVTVHHSPGARESGKNSNAANIAESRPRVSPQHWGELANIFPSHSVSCAKAGADTPRFVPSAPRLRRCTAAAPRAPDPPTATRLRWRPRPRGSHTPRCAGANRRTSAPNPTRVWRPTAFAKGLARPCGRIRFSTAPPCHDSATRHRYAIAGTIIERIGPYAGLLRRPAAHIGTLEPRTGAPARRPSS